MFKCLLKFFCPCLCINEFEESLYIPKYKYGAEGNKYIKDEVL